MLSACRMQVEVDIVDQLDEYDRVRVENKNKQQHWAAELDKLRKAHAGQHQAGREGGPGSVGGGVRDGLLRVRVVVVVVVVQRTWRQTCGMMTSSSRTKTRKRRRRKVRPVGEERREGGREEGQRAPRLIGEGRALLRMGNRRGGGRGGAHGPG